MSSDCDAFASEAALGPGFPQLPLAPPAGLTVSLAGRALSATVFSRPLNWHERWNGDKNPTYSGIKPNSILPSESLVPWQI